MRRGILLVVFWGLGCSDGGKAKPPESQSVVTAKVLTAFDAAVEPLRSAFDVPGVGVAIVSRGRTVFAKGYGSRDVESGDPVTPDTVFRIGSITKSFTSTLVATLADDGALTFDTLAKDVAPTFELPTEELTNDVTIRELLGMGTGLSEPSAFWWDYPEPKDLLDALSSATVIGPEGTFLYNNEVYASGAYVALEAVAPPDELASTYARLVGERLFEPLGMSPAAVTDDPSTLGPDVAASYRLSLVAGPDAPERTGFTPLASVAPAGAIATNVTSLARFAAMQLAHGVGPGGKRVVSQTNLDVTHAAQTPLTFADVPWLDAYAAGWVTGNESGVPLLWHDGAVDGFSGTLRLMPDDDVALVLLTNGWSGEELCLALEEKFMELVHGASELGAEYYQGEYSKVRSQLVALRTALAREEPVDADAVAPFLGDYGHEVSLELDAESDELFVVFPGSRCRVVRADRLLGATGAYLFASGPLVGTALGLETTETGAKLTVTDPNTGDAILILER